MGLGHCCLELGEVSLPSSHKQRDRLCPFGCLYFEETAPRPLTKLLLHCKPAKSLGHNFHLKGKRRNFQFLVF